MMRTLRCHGILLFLLCICLVAGCDGHGAIPAKAGKRAAPVAVVEVGTRAVDASIRAIGNVEPYATVTLRSQVGGMIVEQHVSDGQDVRAGDTLFQLDPRPFTLAIKEAEAKLERDQALFARATADLNRYSSLIQLNVIDQGRFDETKAAARSLEGTIRLNTATLERARLDLEYSCLKAPISGRVGAILLNKGNVLKANDERPVCIINQIEPVFIVFSVPETRLPLIARRMKEGTLTVHARPAGDEGEPVSATLHSIDNEVDKQTGTIKLKALYPNKDHRLWPGQFVRTELITGHNDNTVVIPAQALLDGVKGPYIYVLSLDDVAEARSVTPGELLDNDVVILEGLKAGERVVTDGQLLLAPGAKAEVVALPERSGATQ